MVCGSGTLVWRQPRSIGLPHPRMPFGPANYSTVHRESFQYISDTTYIVTQPEKYVCVKTTASYRVRDRIRTEQAS